MKLKKIKSKKVCVNILFLMILVIIHYTKMNYIYFLCQACVNEKIIEQKCSKCNADIIFKSIKYKLNDETLNELLYHHKSIARFGDGEFEMIFGKKLGFQEFNEKLKEKLLIVLNSNIPNLLIGIPPLYKNKVPFWAKWLNKYKFKLGKIISKSKLYYAAGITRFYIPTGNRTNMKNYIIKFKQLWNNRNILIIEGYKTRLGFGNDLFDNAKTIQRIICPFENAFKVYDKIFHYVKNLNITQNTLILISLGPTATALTYDIVKSGMKNQVIDFGHFDIEYEYYLRKAKKKIRIPNKYVNEVRGGKKKIKPIKDSKFLSQIIHQIK